MTRLHECGIIIAKGIAQELKRQKHTIRKGGSFMKALSFAAAFVLLSAAPVLCPAGHVCAAEEETEAAVPDWIPADFDSAAAFWKQNGSLMIEGDLLCFTEKEYTGDSRYDFQSTGTRRRKQKAHVPTKTGIPAARW